MRNLDDDLLSGADDSEEEEEEQFGEIKVSSGSRNMVFENDGSEDEKKHK